MVSTAVSYNHKTGLHVVQVNMTALKYRDAVLISTVQPLVPQTGPTFQDDNARPHRARIDTEQLWDELGTRTYERHPGIRTRQQLEQVLRQEWQAVPQRTVRNVINSMRSRVNACIDRNGGHTKYRVRYVVNSEISCKCRLYKL